MSSDEKNDEIVEIHAIVNGFVQGIGFRATVRHHAMNLNLKGTVRNLPDGSVEIYVQGPRFEVEKLLAKLKTESGFASVDSILTKTIKPHHNFESFSVVH